MISPSIDTERIGRLIGNELHKLASKYNRTQTEIWKKLGISSNSVSMLLTGKNTTKNLDRYWRIAEAIPISRKEFDTIVLAAKREVLTNEGVLEGVDPNINGFALLSEQEGIPIDDLRMMVEVIKKSKGIK